MSKMNAQIVEKLFANNDPTTIESYQARVQSGALLLDQQRPGWADMIDLDSLDIDDTKRCVLGQCFTEKRIQTEWQLCGYASLYDAMENSTHSAQYWLAEYCTSNYDLGSEVLAEALDTPYVTEAMTSHGFDNVGNNQDYRGWLLLEYFWAEEVRARQTSAPADASALAVPAVA